MPPERIVELTAKLVSHFGPNLDATLATDFDELFKYKPIGQKLIELIDDYEGFIIMWREHFLEHANPEYIAKEWVTEINHIF